MKKTTITMIIALFLLTGLALADIFNTSINGNITLNKEEYNKLNQTDFNELYINRLKCSNNICTFDICINNICSTKAIRINYTDKINERILYESKIYLLKWTNKTLENEPETKQIIPINEESIK